MVQIRIPSGSAIRGGSVQVPILVDKLTDTSVPSLTPQQGLSGGTFVVWYDPTVFSVSQADLALGTLGVPGTPGNGYSQAQPNGWTANWTNTNVAGELLLQVIAPVSPALTGTGGGTLVLVNFHVLPNAPLGLTNIDLASDLVSGSGTITKINDATDALQSKAAYSLAPAPADNTGTVQVVTFGGNITGGTFTLALGAGTSAAITYSATPGTLQASIQAALNATSSIGSGNSLVIVPNANTAVVTFEGSLGGGQVIQTMVATSSLLGINPWITVARTGFGTYGSDAGDGQVTVTAQATHLAVSYPSTATAGHAFLCTVTALDANSVVVQSFPDSVHFTSTDAQAVSGAALPSDSGLTSGTSVFAAYFETAGTQTLTATDQSNGSIFGSGPAVAVTAASATHFGVFPVLPAYPGVLSGPTSFATTALATTLSVAALDQFGNVDHNYAGLLQFTSGDQAIVKPGTSGLISGVGTFSVTLGTVGNQILTATDIGTPSITGNSTFVTRALVVTGFTQTPCGFIVTFNKPFNPATVLVYSETNNTPCSIMVGVGGTQVSLRGSVLCNPTNPTTLTFVRSGLVNGVGTFNPLTGLLAAGNYSCTLRSYDANSNTGFRDALGVPLDGVNTGGTSNLKVTFSVVAPAPAIGMPHFARGPANTQALSFGGTPTGGTFKIIYSSQTTAPISYNATAATLQSNIQVALNAIFGNPPTPPIVAMATRNNFVVLTMQSTLITATTPVTVDGSGLTGTAPTLSVVPSYINNPNSLPGSGLLVCLSNGFNVLSGSFTLQYNPSLLTVSGVTPSSTIAGIAGASFTMVSNTQFNSTSAAAVLSLSSPTRLASSPTFVALGSLLATVPFTAINNYRAAQLLHWTNLSLTTTGGPTTVANQDAVQVVDFFGDSSGDAISNDVGEVGIVAQLNANIVTQFLPGFVNFPLVDPVVIAGVSMAAAPNITPSDANFLQQNVTSPKPPIPAIPLGLVLGTVQFAVVAPATVRLGVPFQITVTAQDLATNTVPGYSGIAHFTVSGSNTFTLPADSPLTSGVGVFSATLTAGATSTVTLTATDTVTPSITGHSSPIAVLLDLSVLASEATAATEAPTPKIPVRAIVAEATTATDSSPAVAVVTPGGPLTLSFNPDLSSATTINGAGLSATVLNQNAVQRFTFQPISTFTGIPTNMQINIGGVPQIGVAFPSDYLGAAFTYVDLAGIVHNGNFTGGTVAF